ncbi:hypothetical protein CGRA01v4_08228 [Colletotrichum graminicola]|nr:hypothetical protein CGRA01v4_08228 [Colletotrichum graminicola]
MNKQLSNNGQGVKETVSSQVGLLYKSHKLKWKILQGLPESNWEIKMSWQWPDCEVVVRRDGLNPAVCELPGISSMRKPAYSATNIAETTGLPSVTSKPPPASITTPSTTLRPLPKEGSTLIVQPIQTATTQKTSTTSSAPIPRWTQTCSTGGLRFDKNTAAQWVEDFCKEAHKKKWSDDDWFNAKTDGKMAKTKGISVYDNKDGKKISSYRFIIHVVKPGRENSNGKLDNEKGKPHTRWCEPKGRGSNLESALDWLREDPNQCRRQLTDILLGKPRPEDAETPSGGNQAGLCLQWTIDVKKEDK